MTNTIKEQFVSDMQLAGLAVGSQKRYLGCVNTFFQETWLSPDSVTEREVQQFFISLREKDVAGETFRGYRFALAFFFEHTMQRDWALFKKKSRRPRSAACP
jgi:site-specific recombinase XerD